MVFMMLLEKMFLLFQAARLKFVANSIHVGCRANVLRGVSSERISSGR